MNMTYEKLFLTFDIFYIFDKKCQKKVKNVKNVKKISYQFLRKIFFIFLYNLILSLFFLTF